MTIHKLLVTGGGEAVSRELVLDGLGQVGDAEAVLDAEVVNAVEGGGQDDTGCNGECYVI